VRAIRAVRAVRAAARILAALAEAWRGEDGDGDEEGDGEAESFDDSHARYGRERAKRDSELVVGLPRW
jgi:hypothetical protein